MDKKEVSARRAIFDSAAENPYTKLIRMNYAMREFLILPDMYPPGQRIFKSLSDIYLQQADGYMLVFSYDNRNSFESIKKYFKKIIAVKNSESEPMVLIGTRFDLFEKAQLELHPRALKSKFVTQPEAVELAHSLNIPYYSTCTILDRPRKEVQNTTKAFMKLAEIVMYKKVMSKSKVDQCKLQ